MPGMILVAEGFSNEKISAFMELAFDWQGGCLENK